MINVNKEVSLSPVCGFVNLIPMDREKMINRMAELLEKERKLKQDLRVPLRMHVEKQDVENANIDQVSSYEDLYNVQRDLNMMLKLYRVLGDHIWEVGNCFHSVRDVSFRSEQLALFMLPQNKNIYRITYPQVYLRILMNECDIFSPDSDPSKDCALELCDYLGLDRSFRFTVKKCLLRWVERRQSKESCELAPLQTLLLDKTPVRKNSLGQECRSSANALHQIESQMAAFLVKYLISNKFDVVWFDTYDLYISSDAKPDAKQFDMSIKNKYTIKARVCLVSREFPVFTGGVMDGGQL